jgi:hypothetical protein
VAIYSGAAYPCVPITWVDTWVLSPVGPAFANPKSDNFALYSCNIADNTGKDIKYLSSIQKFLIKSFCLILSKELPNQGEC